jgi:hypothetical protein
MLPKMPQKVEKKLPKSYINERYELKAGFPVSDLTPEILSSDDWDNESDIAGLYKRVIDEVEGGFEELEFDIEILSEEDNFYIEKPKYKATPALIVQLTEHPALHTERPCFISSKEMYRIVREHVKTNIDPRYAKITSDYDFCLTVEKYIKTEPTAYQVNVGKRKGKYETRYTRGRSVVILKTSPEGYSSYPVEQSISGENQEDLENKVDAHLKEVLDKINMPFIECECCKGEGVILEK